MASLSELWDTLARVRTVRFDARGDTPGWNGAGVGIVSVESAATVLVFSESGDWQPIIGRATRFSNVFRWTATSSEVIRLEHLRFGPDRPVLLFDIAPGPDGEWSSVKPHQCDRDCYAADLKVNDTGLMVRWVVSGPTKRDEMEYAYSW